jgi:hypothetical protein
MPARDHLMNETQKHDGERRLRTFKKGKLSLGGKQDGYAGLRRHALATTTSELAGDGVGSLVVVLDQRAKGIDEIFDLGFLQAKEIELPRDLVQLCHGLFVGDAIGIHVYLLHLAKCSIGKQQQNEGTTRASILK